MKTFQLKPALVFFSALVVYYFTVNQIFSFDALTNAIAAESNEPIRWFHPNHPLYPSLGVAWYRLEKLFGYHSFSIYSLARFNSLVISLGLSFLTATLAGRIGMLASSLTSLFLGCCFGVWHYAVDGRAIGASFFFGCLVVCYLFRLSSRSSLSTREVICAAVFSALYVLMHGIAIFHAAAVACFMMLAFPRQRRLAPVYVLTLGAILAAVFILVYVTVVRPTAMHTGFFRWALGYAGHDGGVSFWSQSLPGILSGHGSGWKNFFFKPGSSGGWESSVSALFGLLMAAVFAVGFFWSRAKIRKEPLLLSLVVWGGLILVFLTFWSPGQEGFRLHALLPWSVALSLLYGPSGFYAGWAALAGTLLFGLNLNGQIGAGASIQNNEGFQTLLVLSSHMKVDDLFLCASNGYIPNVEVLQPYFFPRIKGGTLEGRLFAFNERSLDPLLLRLRDLSKKRHHLYFGDDLLTSSQQVALESRFNIPSGAVASFLQNFAVQPAFDLPGDRHIYEATPR